jgi:outer membrane protein
MKKLALIILILQALTLNAFSSDIKIGYVNLNKALNESDRGKNATKILEEMLENKKTILSEKEKELKEMDSEIKKQASVLTPESLKSKTDEFNKLYKNYQRMVKDFQEELQKKENEFTQEIQKELVEVVNTIGKEEGYTFILELNASGIIYAQKDNDITDKVIQRYNEISKKKNKTK